MSTSKLQADSILYMPEVWKKYAHGREVLNPAQQGVSAIRLRDLSISFILPPFLSHNMTSEVKSA